MLFSLDLVGMWRAIVLGISLAAVIALAAFLRGRHRRQGRNGTLGWTILAAFAAMFIWGGVSQIIETNQHHGHGVVVYGNGEPSEREELVDEIAYKRHHYTMGAFLIGVGFVCLYLLRVGWNSDCPRMETT